MAVDTYNHYQHARDNNTLQQQHPEYTGHHRFDQERMPASLSPPVQSIRDHHLFDPSMPTVNPNTQRYGAPQKHSGTGSQFSGCLCGDPGCPHARVNTRAQFGAANTMMYPKPVFGM